MNVAIEKWLGTSREELDEIYSRAEPGPIPNGDTRGTAILAGSALSRSDAAGARLLAWQGKVFHLFPPDNETGILVNKVTPFSLTFVVATVYKGASWLDGKETIIIDYSKTSFVAKRIRDEIRQVEPGVYLGKVWWGRTSVLDFALTYSGA